MRPLAVTDEQVAFWRRHTFTGVALCVVLPLVIIAHTAMSSPAAQHATLMYALAVAVALPAPLLLLVPVERVARHRFGRLFFDIWEAVGVALVAVFALLDGGVHSPYVMFFYVLLAHATLAYPPVGMAVAGAGNVAGYLTVGLIGGDASPRYLLSGVLTLAVATATCAYASYNHTIVHRRTAAYAVQLAVLAERDRLTGCLNHRTFHQRLQAEAVLAGPGHPLSMLIVDVDSFKTVNDTYGHPAGDEVLRLVGRGLLELSRADDAAGRLGGDEFALLLPRTTSAEAAATADRLHDQVRARTSAYGVTISVGVATTTMRADTAGLLSAADRAVYRAKRAGRDRTAGHGMEPSGPTPSRRRALLCPPDAQDVPA